MHRAPLYDLEKVKAAAAGGKLAMTRSVQRDLQNLGYDHSAACACVAALSAEDFRGTKDYGGYKYDEYTPKFAGPSGVVDSLYVKLDLRDRTITQVFLHSFHLPR